MSSLADQLESSLLPVNEFNFEPLHGLAAVLLLLVDSEREGLQMLLTERAAHLRHHPGEISMPGGMWEEGDEYPVDTALREASEEVALPRMDAQVLGLLPQFHTRGEVKVTPVVGILESKPVLHANQDEVESLFWVPIDFFLQDIRLRTDVFNRSGHTVWAPAYQYQGKEIWGFTAGVIKMFLNQCLQADIQRDHSVSEKLWSVSK